jgi:hypothetical protein
MSEDRMKKAWDAYKVRWEQEEEQRLILEEKKLVILLTKKTSQKPDLICVFFVASFTDSAKS